MYMGERGGNGGGGSTVLIQIRFDNTPLSGNNKLSLDLSFNEPQQGEGVCV